MNRAEVESAVMQALKAPLSDEALRDRLEVLSKELPFAGLVYLWGPVVYRRNRLVFRTLILSHFSPFVVERDGNRWRSSVTHWKDATGRVLEAWLAEADAADDVDLFRRLLPWKIRSLHGWRKQSEALRPELLKRFLAAPSPAARQNGPTRASRRTSSGWRIIIGGCSPIRRTTPGARPTCWGRSPRSASGTTAG